MAKSGKQNRRDVVDQIRSQQKRADARQGRVIIGASILVGLIIVGLAAYQPIKSWWELRSFNDTELESIGAPASVCGDLETRPAKGTQQHVQPGTPVDYEHAPPAFGRHEDVPETMSRKLYLPGDRPNVEKLVHNLEHGYTILWYDRTIANDEEQMLQLKAIAEKLSGTDNSRLKFKAAPWLVPDGPAFPEGQHVALTHWAKESEAKDAKPNTPVGVWQYCSKVSGEALDAFMLKYPYTNSPEPNGL